MAVTRILLFQGFSVSANLPSDCLYDWLPGPRTSISGALPADEASSPGNPTPTPAPGPWKSAVPTHTYHLSRLPFHRGQSCLGTHPWEFSSECTW